MLLPFIPVESNKEKARTVEKVFCSFFFLCYYFWAFFTKWKARNLIPSRFTSLAGEEQDWPHLFMETIPTRGQIDLSQHRSRSLSHPWQNVPLQPACRDMPKGNVHNTSYSHLIFWHCCPPMHVRVTPVQGWVLTCYLSYDQSLAEPSGSSFLMANVSLEHCLTSLVESVELFLVWFGFFFWEVATEDLFCIACVFGL